jgi:hypothetical protein
MIAIRMRHRAALMRAGRVRLTQRLIRSASERSNYNHSIDGFLRFSGEGDVLASSGDDE